MLTASTPGAPLLARTFSHASIDEALVDLKRLHLRLGSSLGSSPDRVGLGLTLVCPAPSLQPHYRTFIATTGRPAPVPRIGTLPLAVARRLRSSLSRPGGTNTHSTGRSVSGRQVLLFRASACDELTPPIHRAPPGQHAGRPLAEGTPTGHAFVPGLLHRPGFDAIVLRFRCVSSGSHTFVFSSHTCPADSGPFPATLTTPALDRAQLAVVWALRLHGDPGGPTSITGTARFMLGDLLHRHHSPFRTHHLAAVPVRSSCSSRKNAVCRP